MAGTILTPVLVGVGAINQRLSEPGLGFDDSEIVVEAAREAVFDSGSHSVGSQVSWIGATRGSSGLHNVAQDVANALGVEAHTVAADLGVPQQALINRALVGISSGRIDAAIVCGGEAKWRTDLARRCGVEITVPLSSDRQPDETLYEVGGTFPGPERAIAPAGPAGQYAMIENARRAANGWNLDRHLDDIAGLWKRFNVVAGTNSAAAFPHRRTADSIRDAGDDNQLLSFPYNSWHAGQSSVDQSAALLFCSTEVAARCGVPRDRWIFPHVALESSHSVPLSRRRDLHSWPAMEVLGSAAEKRTSHAIAETNCVELYSCFPAAVSVQQEELGLSPSGTPTITGGMAFAGGPVNSFLYQSTVAMAPKLRSYPGTFGVVTGVSGVLAKAALSMWSTRPPPVSVLIADLVVEAAAATHEASIDDSPNGRGTVATYTVVPSDDIGASVVAIIDMDSGARAVASSGDADLAAAAMKEEFIGHRVNVSGSRFSI